MAKKKNNTPNPEILNETGHRKTADRRISVVPVVTERRKTVRRRQIDPTTCERDYDDQEIEFMQAMDEYKRSSGRMFPTCSEILEVLRGLGYVQNGKQVSQVIPPVDCASSMTAEAGILD